MVSGLFISSCSIIDLFRTGGILLVNIRAEDNINPTINNQPAPVTLRIYQLKDNVILMKEISLNYIIKTMIY